MILLDWEQKWAIIGWRHSLFTASWTRVYLGGWSLRSMITFGTLFLFVGWFSLHFFRGFFFFNCLLGGIWETLIFIYVFFFPPFALLLLLFTLLPSFYGCMEVLVSGFFLLFFHLSCYFFFSSGMEMEWKEGDGEYCRMGLVCFLRGFFSFLFFHVLFFTFFFFFFFFFGVFFFFFLRFFFFFFFFFFTSVLGTNFSHFYLVFFFLLILTL